MALAWVCLCGAALSGCVVQDDDRALVGTWIAQNQLPGSSLTLTLSADRGAVLDSTTSLGTHGQSRGSYTADATRLTLDLTPEGGQRARLIAQYHLSKSKTGTVLLLPALLPQGMHSGVVGTWTSYWQTADLSSNGAATNVQNLDVATYELKKDGTLRRVATDASGAKTEQAGTYKPATGTGRYSLTWGTGATLGASEVSFLDDAALGSPYVLAQ